MTSTDNVAMTKAIREKMIMIEYSPSPSTIASSTLSRSSSKPEERVAFPRAIPPIARNTIDQWNE